MNYSKNLPKIEYTTELGDIKVTDISSYYVLDSKNRETALIDVSSNTTLLELANTVYSDIESYWLFLYANDTFNPFTLLSPDTVDLLDEYSINSEISTINTLTNQDVIVTEGSLVLPYIANSGPTWQYGSTGNFSLTGGFGFVKSYNPFTKNTIVETYGGISFGLNQDVNFIVNGSTYSYKGTYGGVTNKINYIQTQTDATKEVKYKTFGNLQVFGALEDDLPITSGENFGLPGVSQAITYKEAAQTTDTNIKYFLPYTFNSLNFTKVEQNYIV